MRPPPPGLLPPPTPKLLTGKPRAAAAPTLHDGVLATLRDLLIRNEFPPGERLTERVLCGRLRVSRTPLREALKVLAHEGLVELLPNRGARVTRLTEEDVRQLFEVISALESLAGRLACARITDAELREIKALHARMHAHFLKHDLPGYFRLNQEIHEKIVAAARNPVLAATHVTLNTRLRRARYLASLHDENRWTAAMDEHERFTAALARRAADETAALLLNHLQRKCEVVCEHLRVRSNPPPDAWR